MSRAKLLNYTPSRPSEEHECPKTLCPPPPFADLGLSPETLGTTEALGYEEPTPIQIATFPPRIADLAARHMREPERVTVRQIAYIVPRPYKLEALGRILDVEDPTAWRAHQRASAVLDLRSMKLPKASWNGLMARKPSTTSR